MRTARQLTPRLARFVLNIFAPYVGAGVRVTHVRADWREMRVAMRLRWYNRNAVGTHFGGSLYSMTDPHLMLMLMQLLGREYVVWDKVAAIDFVKPGRGTVSATFTLGEDELALIRERTADGDKYLPEFTVRVVDEQGDLVALVTKVLYVRKKGPIGSLSGLVEGD
ncbi:MAG TPA: DUF4442 domain-containing protein [Geobacteraceae bacterium]